jgi:hypothetical protein
MIASAHLENENSDFIFDYSGRHGGNLRLRSRAE